MLILIESLGQCAVVRLSVNTTLVKDWGHRIIGHQRNQGQSHRASGGPARFGDTVIVIFILIVMIAQESRSESGSVGW